MSARDGRVGSDELTARNGWRVERVRGSVGDLVARPWADPLVRTVRFLYPDGPGIVLGSTQLHSVVDNEAAAAAGIEVVRRPSGGGAVLVEPGRLVWVEVAIGADDPLWQADVGRAGLWLGRAWKAALVSLGVGAAAPAAARGAAAAPGEGEGESVPADSGPAARASATRTAGASAGEGVGVSVAEATVRTEWSPLICFAGQGPGEVSVRGRKVVGVSQRRTRAGARFQCGALLVSDPAALPSFLALDPPARARATDALAVATLGLSEFGINPDTLEAALLAALPNDG